MREIDRLFLITLIGVSLTSCGEEDLIIDASLLETPVSAVAVNLPTPEETPLPEIQKPTQPTMAVEDFRLPTIESAQTLEAVPRVADAFTLPLEGANPNIGFQFMEEHTDSFGRQVRHTGIDLNLVVDPFDYESQGAGAPVVNPGNGICVFAEDTGVGLGNVVIMEHTIETRNGEVKVYSLMSHLNTIEAAVGRYYDLGENVGTVGSSGDQEGAHLHFEIISAHHYNTFILTHGPNYPYGLMNEKYLLRAYYNPLNFIVFRNEIYTGN